MNQLTLLVLFAELREILESRAANYYKRPAQSVVTGGGWFLLEEAPPALGGHN